MRPSLRFSSQTGVSPRVLTTECEGASRARSWCPTSVTDLLRPPSTCFPTDSERCWSTTSRYVLKQFYLIIRPTDHCVPFFNRNSNVLWWSTDDTAPRSPTPSHPRSARTLSNALVNSPSSWLTATLASEPKRTSKRVLYFKIVKFLVTKIFLTPTTRLCLLWILGHFRDSQWFYPTSSQWSGLHLTGVIGSDLSSLHQHMGPSGQWQQLNLSQHWIWLRQLTAWFHFLCKHIRQAMSGQRGHISSWSIQLFHIKCHCFRLGWQVSWRFIH